MIRNSPIGASLIARFLTLVAVFSSLAFGAMADDQGGVLRMRLRGGSEPPPPTTQTAYFGPKTMVGHGGAQPTGITLPATAPDTTSYYWDTTYQWAVPKNGAIKTYNTVRASPLSGCEVMTITDAAAVVFTYNLCADQTIAGDFTVRWRPTDTFNSGVSGTAQIRTAWAVSNYGDHIVMRGGTTINTVFDCVTGCTSGSLLNGTAALRFGCTTGNCNIAGFNGSNHRVFRPELGYTVNIGPIWFEGSGVGGTRVTGFLIDNEAESYNAPNYMLGDYTAVDGMIFENLTILGSTSNPWGGDRPSGIIVALGGAADINNVEIGYVQNGIATQHSLGTPADVFAGSVAPNPGELAITGSYLHHIGRDSFATQCPRYVRLENNVFTDQQTEIGVGSAVSSPPWVNPFASGNQPHSDKVQLNYQNTGTNVCAWQYYPGIIFRNNFFGRGLGHDALTFWSTALGFPNPNNTSPTYGTGIPAEAAVPNPLVSGGDSQGLYSSNFYFDCPAIGPGCTSINRKLVAGTTPRPYMATLDAPSIEGNIITSSYNAGISIPPIRDGTVINNSVINPRVATSTNLETWAGFGNSGVSIPLLEGSPTVARNHGNLSSTINGVTTPPTSQVVEVPIAQYGTVFQTPGGSLSPRTPAEYRQYYRPVIGQALDLGGGAFAGAVCPDGSPNTAATCPP